MKEKRRKEKRERKKMKERKIISYLYTCDIWKNPNSWNTLLRKKLLNTAE